MNIAVTAAKAIYLAIKFWGPKLYSPKKTKSISLSEDVLRLEMFIQDIADASAN